LRGGDDDDRYVQVSLFGTEIVLRVGEGVLGEASGPPVVRGAQWAKLRGQGRREFRVERHDLEVSGGPPLFDLLSAGSQRFFRRRFELQWDTAGRVFVRGIDEDQRRDFVPVGHRISTRQQAAERVADEHEGSAFSGAEQQLVQIIDQNADRARTRIGVAESNAAPVVRTGAEMLRHLALHEGP